MLQINDDGTFTAHVNDVPIHFAIKAFAIQVRKMSDDHAINRMMVADAMDAYAKHVKENYGEI